MPPIPHPSVDPILETRRALWLAGYRPLSVYSFDATRATSPGKQPVGAWTLSARQSPPACLSHPARPQEANTGILCDGLRAIDIDIDDAALADRIEAEARELLGLAPVRYREGSGKRALFYRSAEGEPGKLQITGSAGKLEVLGRGQQIVVSGVHPSGALYEWRDPDGVPLDGLHVVPHENLVAITEGDLAEFLAMMRQIIGAPAGGPPDPPLPPAAAMPAPANDQASQRVRAAAQKALADDCAALASMGKDSGRNDTLNGTAYRLGRFVAAGGLSRSEAEAALEQACSQNGLWGEDGPNACRATIKSGLESGISAGPVTLGERERANDSAPVLDPSPLLAGRHGAPSPAPQGVPVFWHGESAAIPARRELVKGLLPAGEVALIAGQSGAGKTFVALDLAASVALKLEFFGHRVREAGGTLFLLGEGGGTISERLEAVRAGKLKGDEGARALPIAWHSLSGSLLHAETLNSVLALTRDTARDMQAKHGLPLRLIVVDTLAAAFAMQDENDAAQATVAMKVLQRLHAETGALVAAVAHYGKSAETGVRGSSAFTASADAILAVHADRDPMTGKVSRRSLALTKARGRDTGWKQGFELQSVLIGHDEDGDDVWSCWVLPGGEVQESTARASQGKGTSFLLQSLTIALGEAGQRKFPYGAEGPEVIAAPEGALRAAFYERYPANGDTEAKRTAAKNKAFHRALQGAQLSGAVGYKDEGREAWVWQI